MSHSLIIDENNHAWSFGKNYHGQLGLGDKEDRYIPTKISNMKVKKISAGGNFSLIIDFYDQLYIFGLLLYEDFSSPKLISFLKIKDISAGWKHFLIIDIYDDVWSLGENSYGQLGLGDYVTRTVLSQIPIIKNDKNIGFFKAKKISA